jgi:sortase A
MKRFWNAFWLIIAGGGILMMLWPLGQNGLAMWSQHQMQAQWQQEAARWHSVQQAVAKPVALDHQSTLSSRASSSRARKSSDKQSRQPQVHQASKPQKKTAAKANRAVTRRSSQWPPTRLVIPDISLDVVTVHGITPRALRRGPGHDPKSAWPGQLGNCIIAGHRNAWGSYFWRLNELGPGARIELRTPQETYIYRVSHSEIRAETDTESLVFPRYGKVAPRLTLYTCTLPKSTQRILVFANLEK